MGHKSYLLKAKKRIISKNPLKRKVFLNAGVAQLVEQGFRKPKSEPDEKSSTNQSLDDKKDKKKI